MLTDNETWYGVLMPARAFFVFGLCGETVEPITRQIWVLMPARAFFVFGLKRGAGSYMAITTTVLMPARAFFVFGPEFVSEHLFPCLTVLMPARAFFVFGPREGIFCFWTV